MAHLDLVADILQRIADMHGKIPAKVLHTVEVEVRADWGGERHYIAKQGESGRAQLAQRDRAIREEYRRGEHVELLARRHGISVKRIKQIIAGEAADSGNELP